MRLLHTFCVTCAALTTYCGLARMHCAEPPAAAPRKLDPPTRPRELRTEISTPVGRGVFKDGILVDALRYAYRGYRKPRESPRGRSACKKKARTRRHTASPADRTPTPTPPRPGSVEQTSNGDSR